MKTKDAKDLAKDYEFESAYEYFEYIVDSLINGQRQQVRNLFNQMSDFSKRTFLNDFLNDDSGHHTSTRKICIGELID